MSDPMAWMTVAAGAAAGGIVSWLAAPHLASRQEKGRARSEARQAVRTRVGPLLTQVRQYQAHARSSMGREPESSDYHLGDVALCGQLLTEATNLGRLRRMLVTRRAARLFGEQVVELCGVHGESAGDPHAVLSIMINRQHTASRYPERFAQPETGQLDHALRCGPDSDEVARLIKSLTKLAASL